MEKSGSTWSEMLLPISIRDGQCLIAGANSERSAALASAIWVASQTKVILSIRAQHLESTDSQEFMLFKIHRSIQLKPAYQNVDRLLVT